MKRYYYWLSLLIPLLLFLAPRPASLSPSSLSPHPAGAKALFLLLSDLGLNAERLFQPFDTLPRTSHGELMVVAAPSQFDGEKQLLRWVKQGNRLLYFDSPASPTSRLLTALGVSRDDAPISDSLRGITATQVITQPEKSYHLSTSAPSHLHFPQNAELFSGGLARIVAGEGDVWFFPDAAPLRNEYLDREDNLAFLLHLASGRSRVLFDEFHHGHIAPAPAQVSVLLVAFVIFLVATALWLTLGALSRAVRFGPPLYPDRQTQPSTIDHLRAIGLLYYDNACGSVLRDYLTNWRERARRITSLSPSASPADQLRDLHRRGGRFSLPQALSCAARLASLEDGERGDFQALISPLEAALAPQQQTQNLLEQP
jgi:hypothetical protein